MNKIFQGDALEVLKTLEEKSIQTCVTSPPYFGLRDYGVDGQIGLEETPEAFVQKLVEVFGEVKRVLRNDGTLWLNLGDSYNSTPPGNPGAMQNSNGTERKRGTESTLNSTLHGTRKGLKVPTLKPKDLIGIPWRVAFALQADGWILRQDIIWHKPNPMPESVTDRCTKAHEYIFLLSKSPKYYFDDKAIREPTVCDDPREIKSGLTRSRLFNYSTKENQLRMGKRKYDGVPRSAGDGSNARRHSGNSMSPLDGKRNKRSVWTVNTKPYKDAHFATFPPDLIEPCILAGAPTGGVVLDPFFGSGTTGAVAVKHGRQYIGIELNPAYIKLAEERLGNVQISLAI